MPRETIDKLTQRIESAESMDPETKADLLKLLGALKDEFPSLEESQPDDAESIAGFMRVSAHEATRSEPNPESLQLAMDGLASSVRGFETSHPKLVKVVNAISVALSNLGI